MNQKYILTRKESDVVRSIADDGDYFPAQVASENLLTPSEAFQTIDELERKGILTVTKVVGQESPRIRLTEVGGKVRQGLRLGNSLASKSVPSVLVLDDDYGKGLRLGPDQSLEGFHLEGNDRDRDIDKELDRVIKNLG